MGHWVLATIWTSFLLITVTLSQNCSPVYTAYFVVDGSSSLSNDSFQFIKATMKSFANETILKNPVVKIGVVVYAEDVTEVINASPDVISLTAEIDSIVYPNSGTRTHLGIARATDLLLNDTAKNPSVMIVVTDGVSNEPTLTGQSAATAKQKGITMIVFGITEIVQAFPTYSQRFVEELYRIASSNDTVFFVDTFENLLGNITEVFDNLCITIECSDKYTAYIVLDGSHSIQNSNFQLIQSGLKAMATEGITKSTLARIGIVVYSNNVSEAISASSNVDSLRTKIDAISFPSGGTNTHLGIEKAKELLLSDPFPYPGVMIVITDGLSNQPTKTEQAARNAKRAGINMIAVGVEEVVKLFPTIYQKFDTELKSIATSDRHVFKIYNFTEVSKLKHVMQSFCIPQVSVKVDGGYTEWTEWSTMPASCTTQCGTNSLVPVTRYRNCSNPAPTNGGEDCKGAAMESRLVHCEQTEECQETDYDRKIQMLTGVIIGLAVVFAIVLLAFVLYCVYTKRNKSEEMHHPRKDDEHYYTELDLRNRSASGVKRDLGRADPSYVNPTYITPTLESDQIASKE